MHRIKSVRSLPCKIFVAISSINFWIFIHNPRYLKRRLTSESQNTWYHLGSPLRAVIFFPYAFFFLSPIQLHYPTCTLQTPLKPHTYTSNYILDFFHIHLCSKTFWHFIYIFHYVWSRKWSLLPLLKLSYKLFM